MKRLIWLAILLSVLLFTVAALADTPTPAATPSAAASSTTATKPPDVVASFILGELALKLARIELTADNKVDEAAVKSSMEAQQTISSALQTAAKNPEIGKQLTQTIFASYYRNIAKANSAPQASQVANEETFRLLLFQTYQNQRIIELLQQLAAKPK